MNLMTPTGDRVIANRVAAGQYAIVVYRGEQVYVCPVTHTLWELRQAGFVDEDEYQLAIEEGREGALVKGVVKRLDWLWW